MRSNYSPYGVYLRLKRWFLHETYALPVDIFRALAGILCVFYFLNLMLEVQDFSVSDGLVDHEFYLNTFWWLNINLIQPGLGATVFYVLLGFACIGSLGIVAGYRVKLLAALLFLIATCVQRWNFAVMFVDDGIMHILLFWLLLLPVGRTLILSEWIREGRGCFAKWTRVKVPGFAVSCFLGNICWAYFFAGATKAFSPLWQEGLALYAVLVLPISYMPDFWKPEHVPFLKVVSYAALVSEITLPFFLLSPKGSIRKWIGLALQISFNLGIILTLKIPFANIAFIASAVLFFREELMDAVIKRFNSPATGDYAQFSPVAPRDINPEPGLENERGRRRGTVLISTLALAFVLVVCMSTLRRVPVLYRIGIPATQALWAIGIAQDYRLFDWIDRMNYHIDQEITLYSFGGSTSEKLMPQDIFPRSVRYSLIQTRIYDIYWLLTIPEDLKAELKKTTIHRVKKRACRKIEADGRVSVKSAIHRVTADNIDLQKAPRIEVMRFKCIGGRLL